jgi:hypothetical protein
MPGRRPGAGRPDQTDPERILRRVPYAVEAVAVSE